MCWQHRSSAIIVIQLLLASLKFGEYSVVVILPFLEFHCSWGKKLINRFKKTVGVILLLLKIFSRYPPYKAVILLLWYSLKCRMPFVVWILLSPASSSWWPPASCSAIFCDKLYVWAEIFYGQFCATLKTIKINIFRKSQKARARLRKCRMILCF